MKVGVCLDSADEAERLDLWMDLPAAWELRTPQDLIQVFLHHYALQVPLAAPLGEVHELSLHWNGAPLAGDTALAVQIEDGAMLSVVKTSNATTAGTDKWLDDTTVSQRRTEAGMASVADVESVAEEVKEAEKEAEIDLLGVAEEEDWEVHAEEATPTPLYEEKTPLYEDTADDDMEKEFFGSSASAFGDPFSSPEKYDDPLFGAPVEPTFSDSEGEGRDSEVGAPFGAPVEPAFSDSEGEGRGYSDDDKDFPLTLSSGDPFGEPIAPASFGEPIAPAFFGTPRQLPVSSASYSALPPRHPDTMMIQTTVTPGSSVVDLDATPYSTQADNEVGSFTQDASAAWPVSNAASSPPLTRVKPRPESYRVPTPPRSPPPPSSEVSPQSSPREVTTEVLSFEENNLYLSPEVAPPREVTEVLSFEENNHLYPRQATIAVTRALGLEALTAHGGAMCSAFVRLREAKERAWQRTKIVRSDRPRWDEVFVILAKTSAPVFVVIELCDATTRQGETDASQAMVLWRSVARLTEGRHTVRSGNAELEYSMRYGAPASSLAGVEMSLVCLQQRLRATLGAAKRRRSAVANGAVLRRAWGKLRRVASLYAALRRVLARLSRRHLALALVHWARVVSGARRVVDTVHHNQTIDLFLMIVRRYRYGARLRALARAWRFLLLKGAGQEKEQSRLYTELRDQQAQLLEDIDAERLDFEASLTEERLKAEQAQRDSEVAKEDVARAKAELTKARRDREAKMIELEKRTKERDNLAKLATSQLERRKDRVLLARLAERTSGEGDDVAALVEHAEQVIIDEEDEGSMLTEVESVKAAAQLATALASSFGATSKKILLLRGWHKLQMNNKQQRLPRSTASSGLLFAPEKISGVALGLSQWSEIVWRRDAGERALELGMNTWKLSTVSKQAVEMKDALEKSRGVSLRGALQATIRAARVRKLTKAMARFRQTPKKQEDARDREASSKAAATHVKEADDARQELEILLVRGVATALAGALRGAARGRTTRSLAAAFAKLRLNGMHAPKKQDDDDDDDDDDVEAALVSRRSAASDRASALEGELRKTREDLEEAEAAQRISKASEALEDARRELARVAEARTAEVELRETRTLLETEASEARARRVEEELDETKKSLARTQAENRAHLLERDSKAAREDLAKAQAASKLDSLEEELTEAKLALGAHVSLEAKRLDELEGELAEARGAVDVAKQKARGSEVERELKEAKAALEEVVAQSEKRASSAEDWLRQANISLQGPGFFKEQLLVDDDEDGSLRRSIELLAHTTTGAVDRRSRREQGTDLFKRCLGRWARRIAVLSTAAALQRWRFVCRTAMELGQAALATRARARADVESAAGRAAVAATARAFLRALYFDRLRRGWTKMAGPLKLTVKLDVRAETRQDRERSRARACLDLATCLRRALKTRRVTSLTRAWYIWLCAPKGSSNEKRSLSVRRRGNSTPPRRSMTPPPGPPPPRTPPRTAPRTTASSPIMWGEALLSRTPPSWSTTRRAAMEAPPFVEEDPAAAYDEESLEEWRRTQEAVVRSVAHGASIEEAGDDVMLLESTSSLPKQQHRQMDRLVFLAAARNARRRRARDQRRYLGRWRLLNMRLRHSEAQKAAEARRHLYLEETRRRDRGRSLMSLVRAASTRGLRESWGVLRWRLQRLIVSRLVASRQLPLRDFKRGLQLPAMRRLLRDKYLVGQRRVFSEWVRLAVCASARDATLSREVEPRKRLLAEKHLRKLLLRGQAKRRSAAWSKWLRATLALKVRVVSSTLLTAPLAPLEEARSKIALKRILLPHGVQHGVRGAFGRWLLATRVVIAIERSGDRDYVLRKRMVCLRKQRLGHLVWRLNNSKALQRGFRVWERLVLAQRCDDVTRELDDEADYLHLAAVDATRRHLLRGAVLRCERLGTSKAWRKWTQLLWSQEWLVERRLRRLESLGRSATGQLRRFFALWARKALVELRILEDRRRKSTQRCLGCWRKLQVAGALRQWRQEARRRSAAQRVLFTLLARRGRLSKLRGFHRWRLLEKQGRSIRGSLSRLGVIRRRAGLKSGMAAFRLRWHQAEDSRAAARCLMRWATFAERRKVESLKNALRQWRAQLRLLEVSWRLRASVLKVVLKRLALTRLRRNFELWRREYSQQNTVFSRRSRLESALVAFEARSRSIAIVQKREAFDALFKRAVLRAKLKTKLKSLFDKPLQRGFRKLAEASSSLRFEKEAASRFRAHLALAAVAGRFYRVEVRAAWTAWRKHIAYVQRPHPFYAAAVRFASLDVKLEERGVRDSGKRSAFTTWAVKTSASRQELLLEEKLQSTEARHRATIKKREDRESTERRRSALRGACLRLGRDYLSVAFFAMHRATRRSRDLQRALALASLATSAALQRRKAFYLRRWQRATHLAERGDQREKNLTMRRDNQELEKKHYLAEKQVADQRVTEGLLRFAHAQQRTDRLSVSRAFAMLLLNSQGERMAQEAVIKLTLLRQRSGAQQAVSWVLARWRRLQLLYVNRWRLGVLLLRRREELLRRALLTITRLQLSFGLQKWAGATRLDSRRRISLRVLVRRWSRGQLGLALEVWRQGSRRQAEKRRLVSRLVSRKRSRLEFGAFALWVAKTTQKSRLAALVGQAASRRRSRAEAAGFSTWRRRVRDAKEARFNVGLTLALATQRARVSLTKAANEVSRAFALWRRLTTLSKEHDRELRDRSLRAVLNKEQQRGVKVALALGWRRWCNFDALFVAASLDAKHRGSLLCSRLLVRNKLERGTRRRMLNQAWKSWLGATNDAALLDEYTTAWRHLEKFRSSRLLTLVKRQDWTALKQAFGLWCSSAASVALKRSLDLVELQARRRAVAAAVARLLTRRLYRGWLYWRLALEAQRFDEQLDYQVRDMRRASDAAVLVAHLSRHRAVAAAALHRNTTRRLASCWTRWRVRCGLGRAQATSKYAAFQDWVSAVKRDALNRKYAKQSGREANLARLHERSIAKDALIFERQKAVLGRIVLRRWFADIKLKHLRSWQLWRDATRYARLRKEHFRELVIRCNETVVETQDQVKLDGRKSQASKTLLKVLRNRLIRPKFDRLLLQKPKPLLLLPDHQKYLEQEDFEGRPWTPPHAPYKPTQPRYSRPNPASSPHRAAPVKLTRLVGANSGSLEVIGSFRPGPRQ